MLKYLEVLLDLLELKNPESYLKIGEKIEANPNLELECCHRYGFIFQGFADLINKKIDLNAFMVLGDLDSPYSIATNLMKLDSISAMDGLLVSIKNKENLDSKLFIFDDVAKAKYDLEAISTDGVNIMFA